MSDRRAHRTSKNTGGLIVLSVAWVALLGLVPQRYGDKPNDSVGPPSPNNIMIEYLYLTGC